MSNQNQPLVYFIGKSNFGDDEPDFIKIGYTTELPRRVGNIQTSCESEISVMGVIPFDTKEEAISKERDIHLLFGSFRSYREWFYATSRIIQYIEDYAVQYTELFIEDVPPALDEEVIEPDGPRIQDEETVAFGNWLKECREESGLTQAEVAEAVDYSRGAIALIEQGRGMPGSNLREALTALFGDLTDSTTETVPDNPISVKMPDGNFISENTGIDTFIEVIKTIGIEEVKKLNLRVIGIPLIADRDHNGKAQRTVETDTRTYYIVSGTSNPHKKRILENIASRLELDMTVFLRQSEGIKVYCKNVI